MDEAKFNALVDAIVREMKAASADVGPPGAPPAPVPAPPASGAGAGKSAVPLGASPGSLAIDLPDPTTPEHRYRPRVKNPKQPDSLPALIASTTARIGVGRAGPHYNTYSWLLFQADHAITQDALYRDVDQQLLDDLGLFSVQTRITGGKQEYLLRPDLGRQLSDEAKRAIGEKCAPGAGLQIVVGDGLSAAAIEANLRQVIPVIRQGAQAAGLSLGTPFFVKYCRVGVLNDIGDLLKPEVVVLLIGERPGLGRADSMSAYMAYRPKAGDSDAERDVVCNIFENGGTNPLEAGAVVVGLAQKMIQHQASGVKLKLATR